jgi:hypothetical protein
VPRNAQPTGISDSDEIVGNVFNDDGQSSPFLFRYDGANSRLLDPRALTTTPSFSRDNISAVNAAGQLTGYGMFNGIQRAYLATPFWRQADGPRMTDPEVPVNYGNAKPNGSRSSTVGGGCILCSAAYMARSLIALHPLQEHVPIIGPGRMDSLYIANTGTYTSVNDLSFPILVNALAPCANLRFVGMHDVLTSDYPVISALLAQEI